MKQLKFLWGYPEDAEISREIPLNEEGKADENTLQYYLATTGYGRTDPNVLLIPGTVEPIKMSEGEKKRAIRKMDTQEWEYARRSLGMDFTKKQWFDSLATGNHLALEIHDQYKNDMKVIDLFATQASRRNQLIAEHGQFDPDLFFFARDALHVSMADTVWMDLISMNDPLAVKIRDLYYRHSNDPQVLAAIMQNIYQKRIHEMNLPPAIQMRNYAKQKLHQDMSLVDWQDRLENGDVQALTIQEQFEYRSMLLKKHWTQNVSTHTSTSTRIPLGRIP